MKKVVSKKKILNVEVGTLDVSYSSAESVMKDLQDYIEKYGKGNVELRIESVRYSDGDKEVCVYAKREETDEEYNVRITLEGKQALANEIREREDFERLSKKFGSK